MITRRFWTPAECEYLRVCRAAKVPAEIIAKYLPGRTARSVWQQARKLGLSVPQKFRAPDMVEFIRSRNALGWSDSEIAAARGVDRHAVGHVRQELGLPLNRASEHVRAKVAAKTAEQLRAAGLPSMAHLRIESFKARARAAGWPEDLRPRAVQILNAIWDRGPMTRRELATAIGMRTDYGGKHEIRKILMSNDPEGSYTAHLIARGLLVVFKRAGRVTGCGKGRSVDVYSLPINIERRKVAQSA